MRDIDETNITAAVVEAFHGTPDLRLKAIMTSLVGHLHDFVREVELTTDEWTRAIEYLTRTGQSCTTKRQEFILLSDVLGISMLVDAVNHRMPAGTTETTVLGPFYVQNPPELPPGYDVSRGFKGEPLFVEGFVLSATSEAIADAIVDIWQADSEGFYDVQRSELAGSALRGRFRTDREGRFHFRSIMPTSYLVPEDGTVGEMLRATARQAYRPAHLHFLIAAEGHQTLVTHLFVDGDPYLNNDAVFAVKESLIRDFTREEPGPAPDGTTMDHPWRKLTSTFRLKCAVEENAAPQAA
jgi:hydroxyquinol 1,2-dioxygenase